VACATCHDHKFDPILQKDHYALEAFFNNTTQMILDDNRPDAPPIIFLPKAEDRARWLELNQQRELLRNKLAAMRKSAPPPAQGTSAPALPFEQRFEFAGKHEFDGKTPATLPSLDISGDDPFSMSVWVYFPKIARHPGLTGSRNAPVIASQLFRNTAPEDAPEARRDVGPRGWVLDLDEGVPALKLYGDEGKLIRGIALRNAPISERAWTNLTFTYDGGRKEEGIRLYVNGTEVPLERGAFGDQNRNV